MNYLHHPASCILLPASCFKHQASSLYPTPRTVTMRSSPGAASRSGALAQFGAQTLDDGIDDAQIVVVVVAPDEVEELFAAQHHPRVTGQREQQVELQRSEVE